MTGAGWCRATREAVEELADQSCLICGEGPLLHLGEVYYETLRQVREDEQRQIERALP